MNTRTQFTPDTTAAALDAACRSVGLAARAAELVRMGENALYKLQDASIMARVGRSPEASVRETEVANWLANVDIPVVALAELPQPQIVGDMAVTFWELIVASDDPPTSYDLGAMLRRLHSLPAPTQLTLPQFEPMPKVAGRLHRIGDALPQNDRRFLEERMDELNTRYESLEFSLKPGPIHGDAHRDNLMRVIGSGEVKLIDLEDFCIGPREWDVCVEAVGYHTFGWISDSDYESYVNAYGFDALSWSGFPVIKAIRELNMTTWLAQMLGQSDAIDDEVKLRLSDLRNDDATRHWGAF